MDKELTERMMITSIRSNIKQAEGNCKRCIFRREEAMPFGGQPYVCCVIFNSTLVSNKPCEDCEAYNG